MLHDRIEHGFSREVVAGQEKTGMPKLKILRGIALVSCFALAGVALLGRAHAHFTNRVYASPPPDTAAAQDARPAPLEIAREGYLFAGGKYSTRDAVQVMSGQIYAEFQIPVHQRHPYPIVFVHGLGQSGTNFTGTPDGREGWTQFFLRQGYAVYVMDQPGRGRSAYVADLYGPATPPDLITIQKRFTAVERYNLWPQAHLHTQWPGTGVQGDSSFDQFFASQLPSIADFKLAVELNRDAILALLEKIGPAILVTHSQAGAFGWPVADARPDLVKAVIAVEPSGPPFYNVETIGAPEWFRAAKDMQRPWGITAVPLHYSPAAGSAPDLEIARQDQPDGPDLTRCWLQKNPARQLPNLQKVPMLILTSEASYHAAYDHCTARYLEQAGAHPKSIRLGVAGIHGNGHMMMLEKNNEEIAALMARWLDGTFSTGTSPAVSISPTSQGLH
jgi:pimeloyl-ACP methyl ester carboxylesterase